MALRKHVFTSVEGLIQPLNEELEDLGLGVEDERVRAGADISIAKLHRRDLGELTIQDSDTLVRHGLGLKPLAINICMTGPGQVWLIVKKTDTDKLFLRADQPDRTAIVVVSV